MKKYLIKKHCEATERCTVALSRIQDYYYGIVGNFLSRDFIPAEETIRALGYDSQIDAEERLEAMRKHIPMESSGYWNITVEIIEVEV